MKHETKDFEMILQSKDFPDLNYAQFEHLVEKNTADFISQMTKLNAQFIALQDLSPLGVNTKFFPVAGCAAVRRLYQFDLKSKNHYVSLEATAVVAIEETDAKLPGEDPLSDALAAGTIAQGRAH